MQTSQFNMALPEKEIVFRKIIRKVSTICCFFVSVNLQIPTNNTKNDKICLDFELEPKVGGEVQTSQVNMALLEKKIVICKIVQ